MYTIIPTEYQPPLIIDPNAMKTGEITFQGFEPVSRWGSQIIQPMGTIQYIQFAQ
jgi:hypothetical protein